MRTGRTSLASRRTLGGTVSLRGPPMAASSPSHERSVSRTGSRISRAIPRPRLPTRSAEPSLRLGSGRIRSGPATGHESPSPASPVTFTTTTSRAGRRASRSSPRTALRTPCTRTRGDPRSLRVHISIQLGGKIMRARYHAHVAAMSRSFVPFALVVAAACGDSPTNVSLSQGPPARPTLIAVSGDQQTGEVGTVLPYPLVVALRDTLGAVVSNAMVRFYGEDNVAVDSAVTDTSGIASVRWTLGPTASVQQVGVIATVYSGSTGAATATFVVTALAGPVARVQVT